MQQNGPKFVKPNIKKTPVSVNPNQGTPKPLHNQNKGGIPINQGDRVQIPRDRERFHEMFGFYNDETNVLICTPCYGGQLFNGYFHSIIETTNFLSSVGIRYGIKTIANESLITRARNTCVSYFLSHPEYTHLMFIDADVSFPADGIFKLLRADKDVISGVYPKKTYRFDRIGQIVNAEPNTWQDHLDEKLMDYVVNFYSPEARIEKNCIRVKDAPTGFMLIKRDVFSGLIDAYPELQYKNDLALDTNQHKEDTFWLFFDCIKDEDDGRYLSEDYAFCRLLQKIEREIWIEVTIPLSHTGMHRFPGNILRQFDVKPQNS